MPCCKYTMTEAEYSVHYGKQEGLHRNKHSLTVMLTELWTNTL